VRPGNGDYLSFAHRAHDPERKRIALRVFGPPNFPKAAGKRPFPEIGSPEKVASNPIRLRPGRPVVRPTHS